MLPDVSFLLWFHQNNDHNCYLLREITVDVLDFICINSHINTVHWFSKYPHCTAQDTAFEGVLTARRSM